jgi:hypothetical protein
MGDLRSMFHELNQKLDLVIAGHSRIERLLTALLAQETKNMALLDALTAQVAAQATVEQSAITLINGIAARVQAAAGDPVAVAALVTQLQTSASALSAAVLANTPAAVVPGA